MKILDKEYLISSLKDFNEKVLSKIYAKIPTNKNILDKLDESEDGSLMFGGNKVSNTGGSTGKDGKDGISPTVITTPITGGHKITITDVSGDHEFNVMDGIDGIPGQSAYELAVTNGFEGTEQEWLASLQGQKGDPGQDAVNYEILTTKDEVQDNTVSGKVVDSLVIKEVFQSVSDGKGLIASAITDKGVVTDANDTFTIMAENIAQIEISGSSGSESISSPYHFVLDNCSLPFSTGNDGSFTINFPINKLKKLILKKVYLYMTKSLTSNSSGNVYIEIIGTKEGASSTSAIRRWVGSLTQSETYSKEHDITTEEEIDLSEYENIVGIRIGKNKVSGTTLAIMATIKFEADLYF